MKTRIAICLITVSMLAWGAGTKPSKPAKPGVASPAKTKGKKGRIVADTAAKGKTGRTVVDTATKALPARASDSLRALADSLRRADSLARVTDSVRRADSTALAERTWTVALPAGSFRDPGSAVLLKERLELALRRAAKVRSLRSDLDSSGDPLSAARRVEAGKVVQVQVAEDSSGAVGWSARLLASATGAVLDSARGGVPGGKLPWSRLSRAVVGKLLGIAPDSAPRPAPPPATWAWTVESDAAAGAGVPALDSALSAAFAARKDRKALAAPRKSIDSFATANGAGTILSVRLAGKARDWQAVARVRKPGAAPQDSLVLSRKGPRDRVFAWFARHLSAIGDDPRPQDTCAEATRRMAGKWALVPDSAPSPATAKLSADLQAHSRGRLAALPSPLPCGDRACLDSLARSLGIEHLVGVAGEGNRASAKVLDVATDDWIDSAAVADTSAEHLALRLWNAIAPLPGCELCVPDDTLEGALALVVRPWPGATDSSVAAYRDTLERVLSREGDYLVLPAAASRAWTSAAIADSFSRADLRCRTGAARVLTVSVEKDSTGWLTRAVLSDARPGTVVRQLSATDKHGRPSRPVEMASWTARRILGTEPRETAPDPRAFPWRKALLLGIPAVLGIGSTMLHW